MGVPPSKRRGDDWIALGRGAVKAEVPLAQSHLNQRYILSSYPGGTAVGGRQGEGQLSSTVCPPTGVAGRGMTGACACRDDPGQRSGRGKDELLVQSNGLDVPLWEMCSIPTRELPHLLLLSNGD